MPSRMSYVHASRTQCWFTLLAHSGQQVEYTPATEAVEPDPYIGALCKDLLATEDALSRRLVPTSLAYGRAPAAVRGEHAGTAQNEGLLYLCCHARAAVPSYVYHDLGALISSLLCLNARHVGKMNRHGALKMARNLFALQNCLSESMAPVAMLEPQLDRARQLYAVLNCDMEVRASRARGRGGAATVRVLTRPRQGRGWRHGRPWRRTWPS